MRKLIPSPLVVFRRTPRPSPGPDPRSVGRVPAMDYERHDRPTRRQRPKSSEFRSWTQYEDDIDPVVGAGWVRWEASSVGVQAPTGDGVQWSGVYHRREPSGTGRVVTLRGTV